MTFLGRVRAADRTGYRRARYRFPDGTVRETSFFGLALREYVHPERVVVLGTPGSMWDVLIEHLAAGSGAAEEPAAVEHRLALLEAAQAQRVERSHLERLQPLAERALGVACELVLIPYGRELGEQTEVLEALAHAVGRARQVEFDLTHGLRHLAMLGFVAARFLESVAAQLQVDHIWYAAFDLQDEAGVVPVVQLTGLLRLQHWVEALSRFEHDGDYAVFADLLQAEGIPAGRLLRDAAFFESVLNLPEARRRLETFHREVLDRSVLPPPLSLFARRLRERLSWIREAPLYAHQRRLAFLHLRKRDYLRAAILANEAVLTRWMAEEGEGDVNRYEDRVRARQRLSKTLTADPEDPRTRDARRLEWIRNALAHGVMPESESIRQLLRNPERLGRELDGIFSRLLS